jgi:hypothetical protein
MRRTTLATCNAHHRAQKFAVCLIAGIAAESKIIRKPLKSLRGTTGLYDYEQIYMLVTWMLQQQQYEFTPRVAGPQLELWEANAVALIGQKPIWGAVKSVVADLRKNRGILTEEQTVTAIERVLGPVPRRGVGTV